ncbi:MAG: ATP-binding protein [Deltaproteobacteria bacterium]|nr:ATP-binding protein [Deltaproteobacteria bacterium]
MDAQHITDTDLDTIRDSQLTPVPTPEDLALTREQATDLRRRDAMRMIVYLMVFRVALATLLLGAVVAVAWWGNSAENLSGPYGRFVFSLLAVTYLASVAYGLSMRFVRSALRFAYLQIAVDLVIISVLVHATGGAGSGYTFLYLVDIVAMALLPTRNGVLYVAIAGSACMIAVFAAGYLEWLPPITGQPVMPWDLTGRDLMLRVVVNLSGVLSVAALGFMLANQTRRAGERLIRHERFAGDLASLHENTIRSLSSGLMTTTRTGIITSVNDAAAEILGIDRNFALRQSIARHIPGIMTMLERAGPVGNIRRQEIDVTRPDGNSKRIGISATPLSDHSGAIIGRVIHFQDLTEFRRMEMLVQRSERLAGIGRLAAGVAHEIRNPLASISGSVEILRALNPTDPDSQQLAEIVIREVDRLNALISSLLDYTRPPNRNLETIDVKEHLAELAQAFAQGNPRSRINLHAESTLQIQCSSGAFRQLMWNLLRNADEAMPFERTTDCEIRVSATACEIDRKAAVEILIRDNGVGIPPENLDQIFEPFFTAGKASGTGLGLAMVARIVEDHQGTIEVDSRIGSGTTFTVRLPKSPQAEDQ